MYLNLPTSLLLTIGFTSLVHAQSPVCPSGWVAYKDEKCFQLFGSFSNKQDAENFCKNSDPNDTSQQPSLATIKSRPEQIFLTNLVFEQLGSESNAWIGIHRAPGTNVTDFFWNDGSQVRFSNWDVNSPTPDSGRECVEMQSRLSSSRVDNGQWHDVSCGRGNGFVCQKLQMWSPSQIQRNLLDMRINPVPIGFLYTQLPGKPGPQDFWPYLEWSDVSGEYAGQFFRVEGGDSAPWGEVQGSNSPRITSLTYSQAGLDFPDWVDHVTIVEGTSPPLHVGTTGGPSVDVREFLTVEASGGEVRPVNRAVRIWQRHN